MIEVWKSDIIHGQLIGKLTFVVAFLCKVKCAKAFNAVRTQSVEVDSANATTDSTVIPTKTASSLVAVSAIDDPIKEPECCFLVEDDNFWAGSAFEMFKDVY